MSKIGDKIQVVGDDLFVTNVTRLQRGIERVGRQRAAGQGQPDRLADRDPGRRDHGPAGRLRLHDEPPLRRDRGHHHRRPGRGHQLRSDQVRCPGPHRPGGEVQPAAADRGGPRRRGQLRRRRRPSRGSRPDADGPTADRASGSRSRTRSAACPQRVAARPGTPARRRARSCATGARRSAVLPSRRIADHPDGDEAAAKAAGRTPKQGAAAKLKLPPPLQPDHPGAGAGGRDLDVDHLVRQQPADLLRPVPRGGRHQGRDRRPRGSDRRPADRAEPLERPRVRASCRPGPASAG